MMVTFTRPVPPVRRVPVALARRFFQICVAAAAQALEGENLTPLQYAVLAYLTASTGEPDIDQNSLAERLGVDRNNASLLVEQLEADGLLERRINGADRRARLLRLTPQGEKLHRRLFPEARAGQMRILDVLTAKERELFLDLFERVIDGNRDLARPGAGRRKRRPSSLQVLQT
jgi:DNA-binding MarR family transcriptional regulator